MIRITWLALALSLAAMAAPARAAERPAPATAGEVSVYRLRPDDVIDVTVLGLPDWNKTLTILPDGIVHYPRLGAIRAEGKTAEELRRFLFDRLNRFYNDPDVTVTIRSLRTDRATVTGAVKAEGIYEIRRGWTVRELLAAAGGLAATNGPLAPDQMRATLIRKNGQRIALNLAQLLAESGSADVPRLQPDDVLSVEDLSVPVWVEGQVAAPGKLVTLMPGGTVMDALLMAGGATREAALTKAYVRRGDQKIAVNLRQLMHAGSESALPLRLLRYDTLVVPENREKIVVWGGVKNPGPFPLPEDEKLDIPAAISLAGGPVPRARLDKVTFFRKVDGKYTPITVNVNQLLRKHGPGSDLVLQHGDMLVVPDPKQPFSPLTILPYVPLLFGL
jgi:protein involved in polysaccharide export with SLBB domain